MKILLATKNQNKIREYYAIFSKFKDADITSLNDFPDYIQPEETGKTFDENAKIKALHAAQTLNLFALSDDSGIVVPALNGEPGIFSARYAGEHGTYAKNRQKLLKKMEKLSGGDRYAYFQCSIAFASPEKIIKCFSAKCEGTIITEERGKNGFCYDLIFVKDGMDKTFSEIDPKLKIQISHRRMALDLMTKFLREEYAILH